VSTILALGLNLVLNAGVSSRAQLELALDATTSEKISRFFERQGAGWGARGDVIRRAAPAVTEWCEELAVILGVKTFRVELQFDEFKLSATVRGGPTGNGMHSLEASAALEYAARTIERRYGCRARILAGGSTCLEFEH